MLDNTSKASSNGANNATYLLVRSLEVVCIVQGTDD